MTRMTSQSKELVFSKIEHVNQMLKEERDGSVPIELRLPFPGLRFQWLKLYRRRVGK